MGRKLYNVTGFRLNRFIQRSLSVYVTECQAQGLNARLEPLDSYGTLRPSSIMHLRKSVENVRRTPRRRGGNYDFANRCNGKQSELAVDLKGKDS